MSEVFENEAQGFLRVVLSRVAVDLISDIRMHVAYEVLREDLRWEQMVPIRDGDDGRL